MLPYDNTLQEIKDRIDIVDLISEYVHLKKAGQNWKGLCPFHSEKTPSFTVSPSKQIFHCFGCGTGGDIFTFLIRYENLSFPEALKMLAKRAGVTLKTSQPSAVKSGEKESLLNIHKDALDFYRKRLSEDPRAQGYLKNRGITDDAIEMFSLGYAPKSWDALLNYLAKKGYKSEIIKKAGLVVHGSKGYYDTFRDRIIFPIHDLKGDVVAFGGRSIDGSEPKYLNSTETPIFNKRRILYGLNLAKDAIKRNEYVLFMEGYLDVITAHIHGFSNAVAPLGTAFTQEHGRLIKRFTEDIVLVFDSDQAGIKAAKGAANILFESGLNVRILTMPEGEDPDSFLQKKGREAFERLLEHPLSIIDFLIKQGGEKRLIAREAIETISKISDRVLQGEYVRILAERLRVNELFILEELKRLKRQARGGYKKADSLEVVEKAQTRPLDEIYIIKLFLQIPEKVEKICNILSEDDFKDGSVREIFKKIQEGAKDFDELLQVCEGEEKALLTEISLSDDFENPEKVLNDCIKRFKDNRRRRQLRELEERIKEAEKKKDFELLKSLQAEHQRLLREGK
jgi:DNA primase